MDSMEIYGTRFLRCEKEDCRWNIGYTPGDLNRFGLEFTLRPGVGTRICNFGPKALAYGRSVDRDCPHKKDVCELLGEYDAGFQQRFWGVIDPQVAERALDMEPD